MGKQIEPVSYYGFSVCIREFVSHDIGHDRRSIGNLWPPLGQADPQRCTLSNLPQDLKIHRIHVRVVSA